MNPFIDLNIDKDKLHPKFKLLKYEPYYNGAKEIVSEWVKDFIDRDGDIVNKFQTSFHSSFWEFYLHAVLKELNYSINYSQQQPDFIITSPCEFYIEAVVSQIKKGGRLEEDRNIDDYLSMLSPIKTSQEFSELIDEAITRHSSSINEKHKKYTGFTDRKGKKHKGYIDYDWVDSSKPYIIGLGSFDQVNYGKEYVYSMLALLYGLYYCPEENIYYRKTKIKKPVSGVDIEIGLFRDKKYEDISAVIFSNTLTLGKLSSLSKSKGSDFSYILNVKYDDKSPHYKVQEVSFNNPEHLFDGLYIFHNPHAKNKINNIFNEPKLLQFNMSGKSFDAFGGYPPLVVRFCQPESNVPTREIKELYKATLASEYNNTIAYEYKKYSS